MPDLVENKHFFDLESKESLAHVWHYFAEQNNLSPEQIAAFRRYSDMLIHFNKQVNLTAIESPRGIIKYHYADSLMLSRFMPLADVKGLIDVGTGAGFPALPLKIAFPHLDMILIEPNGKKRHFLETVIAELGLENVQTCAYDWRTFIRTTESEINLFVSRAALPVDELCRLLKPGCSYRKSTLVYWASEKWEPEEEVKPFITSEQAYKIGSRRRRLIFLGRPLD